MYDYNSNVSNINFGYLISEKGPKMTNEEYLLFRSLIYNESGMYFKDTKKEFVESKIIKRLKANNIRSIYRYYKHLISESEGKREFLVLIDTLRIGETSFFRNRPQFDLFREKILPEVIEEKKKAVCKAVKIWSAGCSTGEEPYTIAMECYEAVEKNYRRGLTPPLLEIIGSDISFSALKTAKAGIYSKERIEEVEEKYLMKYFNVEDGNYTVSEQIRRCTVFDFHNLKNENGLRDIDIIFCRNVMIYFDLAEQKRLIDKFYASLKPGGYLFIGHSETLQGLDDRFKFTYFNKGTAYKRI